MKIAVLGAAGQAGSRIVAEARSRGHHATAVVRRPIESDHVIADASDAEAVGRLAASHDALVHAVRPPFGREALYDPIMESVLAGVRPTDARLYVVGGAAALRVPDTGDLLKDDPRYTHPDWMPTIEASYRQYLICAAEDRAAWTYAAPPAEFEPGKKLGAYRRGSGELLVGSDGRARLSMEDFALALLDEIETPTVSRSMITFAY
ncbi:NAD(P)-dependent oxidoreductase [Salininema proteolyticum]|uniref:NAD(P)-dependent oxidoreductase n=1 Tax=Salininema proteolyticum TaxID=1607685 RepID=A0ABV8TVR2_9ACTN